MENRIDGVVVLVFVLCLKVSCHATLMALVEIHYYLCDDPIDVSSEKKKKKKLGYCILKVNALLPLPHVGTWKISSVSCDNMESTS